MADAALAGARRFGRPVLPVLTAQALLLAALSLYVGVLALWPLLRLFAEALAGDGGPFALLAEVWASRATQRALANTLEAGVWSSLLAVVLGTGTALAVGLTDVRGKAALVFLLLLPLLVPPQITALAWLELAGPSSPVLGLLGLAPPPGTTNPLYSPGGVILVMGVEHATIVFLAVRAGLRALPRDLVEAARLAGAGPRRVVVGIVLPLLRPAVLAGGALAFVSAIGNFGVPALLGIPGRYPLLTTLIYQRLNGFGPKVLGEVAALAMILAALAAAGLAVRAALAARGGAVVDRTGGGAPPFALGRWRPWLEAGLWGGLTLLSVLPLCALLATSLSPALGVPLGPDSATLANYRFALVEQEAVRRAFANSFALAAAAAVVSALVSVPLAYLLVFRRSRLARVLDLVADAPYAVPGIVLSIAAILVFLQPLPLLGIGLYGTVWIILAAYLARFLALALRPALAGMEQLDRTLEEAAQMAGAGLLRRLATVVLPLAAPSAAAGGLLVFMTAFNELTVSALLWSTGNETLGVMVFSLHYEGNSPAAAAVAAVSVLVTVVLALLVGLAGRRLPDGVVPWRA
ncbi:ABC transporter permease [Azospirillum sp. ST 5-10]|uniref:ABC transporter permease n=1 Tax=unclassified Azospirillum TaxID=2630922 RepID=UPI003F4A7C1B